MYHADCTYCFIAYIAVSSTTASNNDLHELRLIRGFLAHLLDHAGALPSSILRLPTNVTSDPPPQPHI